MITIEHFNFFPHDSSVVELGAIWLSQRLTIANGKWACRIMEGMEVAVENGKLINCKGLPTHRIIGCYGTIDSRSLSIQVVNLQTYEPSIIKLQ